MRKIITFVLILGVLTTISSAIAQSGGGPLWVSGEVASIYEDQDGALISLKLADGETYNISATNDQLKGIHVGDHITVEIFKGWAELIERGMHNRDQSRNRIRKRADHSGLLDI